MASVPNQCPSVPGATDSAAQCGVCGSQAEASGPSQHSSASAASNSRQARASGGRLRQVEKMRVDIGRIIGSHVALRKRGSETPVHSLMLPAVEYQPSRRVKLQTLRTMTPIRLGRLLEQQPDWVWTAIEPLDPALPLPAMKSDD